MYAWLVIFSAFRNGKLSVTYRDRYRHLSQARERATTRRERTPPAAMASAASVLGAKRAGFIGLGRLGICTALKFEQAGWDICGVDVFPSYVESINAKTLRSSEPGVNEALRASKNLRATLSLRECVDHSDLVFILVATPTAAGDEAYDTTVLGKVLNDIADLDPVNKHIVICCTVLPGYIANTGSYLLEDCEGCTLSYNPEFIAQGAIMHGLSEPDVVLIGEGSEDAGDILQSMYEEATANQPRICRMSPQSAEIMKLSVNCFVTTKISYANMVGDIADATPGADKVSHPPPTSPSHPLLPPCPHRRKPGSDSST